VGEGLQAREPAGFASPVGEVSVVDIVRANGTCLRCKASSTSAWIAFEEGGRRHGQGHVRANYVLCVRCTDKGPTAGDAQ